VARILRGDVRWADLDPTRGHEQSGQRPVLILSADVFNQRSGTVIAVALTTQPQRAGFPLTLESGFAQLPKPSLLKISQIRTLSVQRIGRKLGAASPEEVARVIEGLNQAAFRADAQLACARPQRRRALLKRHRWSRQAEPGVRASKLCASVRSLRRASAP